jgi:hypothetical protein
MLDSDCMGRDMHYTDKRMMTMPRPKEISQRIKSIFLLGPSIGTIQCKVEEPIPVRVMIRIVEILLYLIFQESQTSKLSLQNSLSFRQIWTPIVADKHWTCGNYRLSWWHVHMKMASLLSQPTNLNRSLQLVILKICRKFNMQL